MNKHTVEERKMTFETKKIILEIPKDTISMAITYIIQDGMNMIMKPIVVDSNDMEKVEILDE